MSKTTDQLRGAATAAPKPAPGKPPARTILQLLDDPRVGQGIQAVAGKYLDADRMLRLCVGAIKRTPRLLMCEPSSVLGAMMTSAALGLEPNTVQQQAFLIPYKRRANVGGQWVDVFECQFQIGYRGYITLAYRHPRIKTMEAHAVRERDHFRHMVGSRSFLEFALELRDRGEVVAAFSYVSLHDGGELSTVLPLQELHKIRGRSETYKSALWAVENAGSEKDKKKAEAALLETPWVMWFDEMTAKTAIRRHSKQLPIAAGDQLALAAAIDNDGDGAPRVNLAQMANPEVARAVMGDEIDVPLLSHDDSEPIQFGEAFGATAREREPVGAEGAPSGSGDQPPRGTMTPVPPPNQAPAPAPEQGPREDDARQQGARRRPGPPAAAPAAAPAPRPPAGDFRIDPAKVIDDMRKASSQDDRDQLLDVAKSALSADEFDQVRAVWVELKS